MPRRSIDITGFHHANPIPAASRIGPLVVSGVIAPRDPGSDDVPDEAEAQVANLFRHIGEMLQVAGADWRHVARINFYVPDLAQRAAINRSWLEHFPDATDRPARHTQASPASTSITCDFIAYVDD